VGREAAGSLSRLPQLYNSSSSPQIAASHVLEYGAALVVFDILQWAPANWHSHWRASTPVCSILETASARVARATWRWRYPSTRRNATPNRRWGIPLHRPDSGRLRKVPGIRRGYLGRVIRLEGGEHFDEAGQAGRACWWPPPHLGNWELSASRTR